MAARLPTRVELAAGWARVGPNALPRPPRVLFRLFVMALVGQLLLLEQPGLALVAVLLSLLPIASQRQVRTRELLASVQAESPHFDQHARELAQINVSEVVSWWQCGPLVMLTIRSGHYVQSTGSRVPARSCYQTLWLTDDCDEMGRRLLRELRQLDARRSVER